MKHRISRYRHRLKASNFNPQNKANSNWAGKTNGWAYSIASKRENALFFFFNYKYGDVKFKFFKKPMRI